MEKETKSVFEGRGSQHVGRVKDVMQVREGDSFASKTAQHPCVLLSLLTWGVFQHLQIWEKFASQKQTPGGDSPQPGWWTCCPSQLRLLGQSTQTVWLQPHIYSSQLWMLQVLGQGTSKGDSWWGLFSCLQTATFLLCPNMERDLWCLLLCL